jgi:hypothetical protein
MFGVVVFVLFLLITVLVYSVALLYENDTTDKQKNDKIKKWY